MQSSLPTQFALVFGLLIVLSLAGCKSTQLVPKDTALRSVADPIPVDASETLLPTHFYDWDFEAYTYKETPNEDLHLFAFSPDKQGEARMAILFVHGGGWTPPSGPQIGFEFAEFYKQYEIVAFTNTYRLSNNGDQTPIECLQDVRSSIRYIRRHAEFFGIDPNKVVVAGFSSGGHLAISSAMFTSGFADPLDKGQESAIPNAVIAWNPCVNAVEQPIFVDLLMDRIPASKLSPTHNIRKGIVPVQLFHGTMDQRIPVQGIRDFQTEMRAAGNICELEILEGRGHSLIQKESDRYSTRAIALEFLNRQFPSND